MHIVEQPNLYRGRFREGDAAAQLYADDVARVVAAVGDDGLCAFFAESMQSCAGQMLYPRGYLPAVFE